MFTLFKVIINLWVAYLAPGMMLLYEFTLQRVVFSRDEGRSRFNVMIPRGVSKGPIQSWPPQNDATLSTFTKQILTDFLSRKILRFQDFTWLALQMFGLVLPVWVQNDH